MSSKKMLAVLGSMIVLLGLAAGGYALVDHKKTQEEQTVQEEAEALFPALRSIHAGSRQGSSFSPETAMGQSP